MLRWAIRAVAANSYKRKAISESNKASSKSSDARDILTMPEEKRILRKNLTICLKGLGSLCQAVSHTSNSVEPLAEMSFVASLLVE